MKSIVYSPEEVKAALEPTRNPKRHVFLITTAGDIICCDVDSGWIRFVRPESCTLREWGMALKSAITAMQHHLKVAKSIHDDFMDTTQPNIQFARLQPSVIVNAEGTCPACGSPSDSNVYPYCEEHGRLKGA